MSTTQLTHKEFFAKPNVVAKFTELMGERKARAFVTSIVQVATNNSLLAKADPMSIYQAAATAATLDLPINQSLGFAYIVPYSGAAQFQIGYKGLIQLALRSGQYKTIGAKVVYDGQLVDADNFDGFAFDWKGKRSDVVIGYAAHFALLNGFEKTIYASKAEVKAHAMRYSQTAKKGFGVWKDNEDEMALKTVLKKLLKFGPLSVEMQQAVVVDQSVITDHETMEVAYVDNEPIEAEVVDKVAERRAMVEAAQNEA